MGRQLTAQLKILISGRLGVDPGQGGSTWAFLQYQLGFKRLGYDVHFVETVSLDELAPRGTAFQTSLNARYFQQVMQHFGLVENASLIVTDTHETTGRNYQALCETANQCDILLNISGRLRDVELFAPIPVRIYLDIDPAFTQLWQAAHGIDMHLGGHTHHVTIGRAIGSSECAVPTCGVQWMTMNQPIVLERWPVADAITYDGLTTIANWRGYGSAEYQGVFYGQKAHSLRQFIDLPRRCPENFILALGIHPDEVKDLTALRDNNWHLIDPIEVASTPWQYQNFIRGSKAEFGIAKSGYVLSRCGWFSDRSICYLASGRPVIAQDTGFSHYLPTGEGLIAFSSPDDVIAAVEEINRDYSRHAAAARRIVEEHFDSDIVLRRLLQEIGAA